MRNPLESLYHLGYRIDTTRKFRSRKHLPAPVISIGNITTGGTGKTPAVIALAAQARSRGYRPAILTRGYRGNLKGPVMVSVEMYEADVGDEPLLMAEILRNVPVIKGADRYASGMHVRELMTIPPDLYILDDGFQHRQLARNVDVLLINAQNPFDNHRLLPMGLLREPLDAIGRASVIILTKARDLDLSPIREELVRYNPDAPVYVADHRAARVTFPDGHREDPSWLQGRSVFALSGIAHPRTFIAMLKSCGADIAGSRSFGDHHRFTRKELATVTAEFKASGAECVITTEKDFMRLRKHLSHTRDFLRLGIEFDIDNAFYDTVFTLLATTPSHRRNDA